MGVTHSDGVTNDFERRIRLLPRWNMLTEERKEDCLLENRTPMHPSILTIRSHPMSDVLVLVATAVPTSSPSRGGDVAVYVFDIKQLSLPTPRPQSSQLADSLWTDSNLRSGISVCDLISTEKKSASGK